jgi:hypothetical protein
VLDSRGRLSSHLPQMKCERRLVMDFDVEKQVYVTREILGVTN